MPQTCPHALPDDVPALIATVNELIGGEALPRPDNPAAVMDRVQEEDRRYAALVEERRQEEESARADAARIAAERAAAEERRIREDDLRAQASGVPCVIAAISSRRWHVQRDGRPCGLCNPPSADTAKRAGLIAASIPLPRAPPPACFDTAPGRRPPPRAVPGSGDHVKKFARQKQPRHLRPGRNRRRCGCGGGLRSAVHQPEDGNHAVDDSKSHHVGLY